jgi:hypothetical protein
MKSYIKMMVMSGVLAGTAACTDLDTEIKTHYTQFPNNEIAVSGEFAGCYYYHRNEAWFGRNFWEGVFLSGDEAVGIQLDGIYYEVGRYYTASVHDFNPDRPSCGLLGDMMSGCSYTNQRILSYGGEDGTDPVVAPLRAIRAFYHFWMMEVYGDVPILDHVTDEGEVVERKPRKEVAEFIEKELLAAIPDLTETNDASTYGRPNKWMAEALLVKLYLNWGVYTNDITTVNNDTPNEKLDDCVKWCDELIQSGMFEVGKGYRKKFYPDNGVQIKDFIYAVPFDSYDLGTSYSGAHQMMRFWDYRKGTYCKPYLFTWQPVTTRAGIYVMTPEAVDRFCLKGDERNDMIAVGPQTSYDLDFNRTNDTVMVYTSTRFRNEYGVLDFKKEITWKNIEGFDVGAEDLGTCMEGARCFKYPAIADDDTRGTYIWESNDIPIFRFADILLTKAECILRGATATNGDTYESLINEVRDCASAPHVDYATEGSDKYQLLLDERSREFINEPWRRNDLIRFGKFENCAKWKTQASPSTMSDVRKRVFPIPTGELDANTNWKQNDSY